MDPNTAKTDFNEPKGNAETLENGDYDKPSAMGGEGDRGADTELRRVLSSRHLTMIALGSSIGMGLWLGSGAALAKGGPASIFIGYLLAATIVWSVCHAMGEMAVMYPLPSAFVQWSSEYTTIFASG